MSLVRFRKLKIFLLLIIFTPKDLNALIVCKTSSDFNMLSISQIPFEIEGIIMDLCDIDLSPGILALPFIPLVINSLIILKFEI